MKKCLFLAYGGGHTNTLLPVVKKIQLEQGFQVTVIGINLALEKFREEGIPCKSLSSYMNDEILTQGRDLALTNHDFSSNVSYVDSIAYYGYSMRDLIKTHGEKFAYDVLDVYDRRLFLPVDSMKEIISKEQPDVVVVTSMHRFEAATIIAANELNIPSIRVEDLMGNINKPFPDKIIVETIDEYNDLLQKGITENKILLNEELQSDELQAYADEIYQIYYSMQPTKFAVMSDYAKDNIIKRGLLESSIVITGQPAFDYLITKQYDDRYFLEKYNLDLNKKIVTYMSQPLPERENVLRTIINSVSKLKDTQLIIKLHPNEDGIIHKLISEEMDYKFTIIKDELASEIMHLSDVVITISSTTGIEAALMGKKVLSINLTNNPDFIPFNVMGIGQIAYSQNEADIILKTYLDESCQVDKTQSTKERFKADGNSAQRIVDLIKSLV